MTLEESTTEVENDFAPEKLETTTISMDNLEQGITSFKQEEVAEEIIDESLKQEPIVEDVIKDKDKEVVETAPATLEYSDDKVLEYLKSKGIEANDFESLKKPKEVNPYENLLDTDDLSYLNYKKETGKQISRKDFDNIVTKDYSKVSPFELAKEKVINDSGIKLSDEEVTEYLEEELGFDPNSDDLTPRERIKLASFVKDIREKKIEEQKTILDRLPDLKAIDKEYDSNDYVKLDNGAIIKKTEYEAIEQRRNNYIRLNKEAVSRATDFDFNMTVDDNGVERQLNFTHKLEPKDLQRLESMTTDVFSHFEKTFKKGDSYDVDAINKNMAWLDDNLRGKMLDSFMESKTCLMNLHFKTTCKI
jgi:hypothetical protein